LKRTSYQNKYFSPAFRSNAVAKLQLPVLQNSITAAIGANFQAFVLCKKATKIIKLQKSHLTNKS